RREDGAYAARPHAGRGDQALARPQAARAAEAGVTAPRGRRTSWSATRPRCDSCVLMAARLGVALRRHRTIAAREFEELAQQARRHRGNRIDAQHRRARRADHLVGDAEQALVAAAEERPDDRELAEHVVEAVERNEGAAHADLVAMVVDVAIDRAADG